MKEATGELNMTLVVVISVAALAAFFYTVVWPNIESGIVGNTKCAEAVCDAKTKSDGMVTCRYYDKNGNQKGKEFKCVWKG